MSIYPIFAFIILFSIHIYFMYKCINIQIYMYKFVYEGTTLAATNRTLHVNLHVYDDYIQQRTFVFIYIQSIYLLFFFL